MRVVSASGSGAQRGAALGMQLSDELPRAWQRWCGHFEAKGTDPHALAERLEALPGWATAERHMPDLVDELQAMAAAADMPWRHVAALSLLDESWALTGGMACTAVAVTRGPVRVAGQNMDLPLWTDTLQTVLRVTGPDGLSVVAATFPGSLATCGANSNGVVVVVNALDLATDLSGVAVDMVTRAALHQPSAREAIALIREVPHAVGQTYTVLDADDLFMVEAAADGVVDVPLHDTVSVHTNHAFTREHEVTESSRTRYDAVTSSRDRVLDATTLIELLEDRESGVCQRAGRFTPDMFTFMGVVGDAAARRVWVNASPASGSTFAEVAFD